MKEASRERGPRGGSKERGRIVRKEPWRVRSDESETAAASLVY